MFSCAMRSRHCKNVEEHWADAVDVTSEILQIVERHTIEYSPFDVYARTMVAYFRSHEVSVSEWEKTKSQIYPVLDQYQREGYHRLLQIAGKYRGSVIMRWRGPW